MLPGTDAPRGGSVSAPVLLRFLRLCAALASLVVLNGCQCSASSTCGDGVLDIDEQCDDQNVAGGDGCSATCQLEAGAKCGDGVVDPAEQCDDGNAANGDGCSFTCQTEIPPGCGDGVQEGGEACDDGNNDPGDGCSAVCQLEHVCGDGVVQAGEQCDDGNMDPADGCEPDCTTTPAMEVVCEDLPPLAEGTCEVTPGDEQRLIKGVVLTPGTVYRGGRVLVDAQGFIACAGCDCEAPGATQITCPQGVISPGLINTHEHITYAQNRPYNPTAERYEHRHDWRRGNDGHTELDVPGQATADQISWGELRFLFGGATSLVGSGSATGLLRNLDKAQQEGLGQTPVNFDTFPLGDTSGNELEASCNYPSPVTAADIEMDEAYCPHIAEGIETSARNEFLCLSAGEDSVILPQTAIIHGAGLIAADYAAMAANGAALIWSPRSNISLYGDTAVVTTAARLGVQLALGTDWVATGSMNLLRELRCADTYNQTYLGGYFSDEALWMMVTANAAAVTATDDVLGVLAPGKVGDIAIFDGRTRSQHRAVLEAEPKDVVLVLRSGRALYGDEAVVSAVSGGAACDAVDVCGAAKQVCLQDEVGKSYTELQQSASTGLSSPIYPAFFCGEPDNEPLCTPSRAAPDASVNGSTVYTGQITAEDMDGDGVANATDNCPTVFNPVRPLDDGAQADFDGDGDGDACDVCPIDADTTMCTAPNPNDSDNDGVQNSADNCPSEPNPDQADGDMDLKGDLCDACPADANPGPAGCPTSIYDIKSGAAPVGTVVAVSDVLVTGKHASGFFVQVKPGDPGYAGPEHSGVYVYNPGNPVLVGDRVSIPSATVTDFFGQIQLGSATVMVVQSMGEAPPAPVVVAPADVATGGAMAAALEGVIVEVQDVEVVGLDAMYNEFIVTDDLRVNDLLYLVSPLPAVGDAFTAVRGILNYRNNNSKIELRGPEDLVLGPPSLAGFGPPLSYAYVGQAAAPTFPTPLAVTLTSAPQVDTFVAVTSGDPALTVVGGGVTVPAGATGAEVLVDGLAQAQAVTLTATLGAASLTAEVRVLDPAEMPALVSLTPDAATLPPGGAATFTVTLDIPAPAGGTAVSLAVAPAAAGTLPATVTVPAGQVSASFDYVDAGVEPSATVTATLGASSLSAMITVSAPMGGLVINEVDYDQPGTDTAEFVEIYNGTGAPVNLAGHALVLVNGSNNAVYGTIDLAPAGTLSAGQYLVVGNAAVAVPAGALKINTATTMQNGSPDGVALVDTAAGVLVDALSYEGSITTVTISSVGMVSLVEGTALPAAIEDSGTAPGSLCRLPDGADTNDAAADWAFTATSTPGAANVP